MDKAEDELASLLHLDDHKTNTHGGNSRRSIDVTYLLDMPHGFQWKGVFIDASLRAIRHCRGAWRCAPCKVNRKKTFMQLRPSGVDP